MHWLREWLIEKLAGRDVVMINCAIFGQLVLPLRVSKRKGLLIGNYFLLAPASVPMELQNLAAAFYKREINDIHEWIQKEMPEYMREKYSPEESRLEDYWGTGEGR